MSTFAVCVCLKINVTENLIETVDCMISVFILLELLNHMSCNLITKQTEKHLYKTTFLQA